MPSLTTAQTQLNKFSDKPEVKSVLTLLENLQSQSSDLDKNIETLRTQLNNILNTGKNNHVKKDGISLADAAYTGLLALAEFKPLFQDNVPDEHKVIISTGHIFDINTLIKFHNTRKHSDNTLYDVPEETPNSKWLINPVTRTKFNNRDLATIQAIAKKNHVEINSLITADDLYKAGKQLVNNRPCIFSEGERLLRIAADHDQADAACLLSKIYFDALATESTVRIDGPAWWGQKQDFNLGYRYLKHAIALGHQKARLTYADFLYHGKEQLKIAADKAQALALLDELVEENYLKAILAKIQLLCKTRSDDKDGDNLSEADKQVKQFCAYKVGDNLSDADKQFKKLCEGVNNQEDLQSTLPKVKRLSEIGSILATRALVDLYERGDNNLNITPDEKLATFYRTRLIELEAQPSPENKLLLSLLEKASSLGDAEISYELARLYFNGQCFSLTGLTVNINIDVAMKYLQLSVDQGKAEAAENLAGIYLGESCPSIFGMTREHYPTNIPYNLQLAISTLEKCFLRGNNDNQKSVCAFKLATLYRENEKSAESIEQRRQKMMFYYDTATKLRNNLAITAYGVLLLVGDEELQVPPNLSEADKILALATSALEAYLNARGIAANGHNSPEHITRYIYWLIKSIDYSDDSFDFRSRCQELANLLKFGKPDSCRGRDSKLSLGCNLLLAAQWEHLCALIPADRSFGKNAYIKSLHASKEYQDLIRATYQHFNLPCPFNFEAKDNESTTVSLRTPNSPPREIELNISKDTLTDNRYFRMMLEFSTITLSSTNNDSPSDVVDHNSDSANPTAASTSTSSSAPSNLRKS